MFSFIDYYLLNDAHVLHLRSETITDRRRMNMVLDDYDGQMTPGDECGPNFLTSIFQLRKNTGKNLSQETEPTGDLTRVAALEAKR